ncbi:MAG: hypothetical protein C5B47_08985 [Verrucomicrobia bacterium]|nr:MAG: hypothetical protein C5B47_08985 [Verrucomicrobiota bacterium]
MSLTFFKGHWQGTIAEDSRNAIKSTPVAHFLETSTSFLESREPVSGIKKFQLPNDLHILMNANLRSREMIVRADFLIKNDQRLLVDKLVEYYNNKLSQEGKKNINFTCKIKYPDWNILSIEIVTEPSHVNEAIDLLSDVIKNPNFPEDDDLRNFKRESLVGGNGVITIFGSGEIDLIYAKLKSGFQDLPAGQPLVSRLISKPPVGSTQFQKPTLILPDNSNKLQFYFPMPFSLDDVTRQLIRKAVRSEAYGNVRDKNGLAYRVEISQPDLLITIHTDSDRNREKVVQILRNVFRSLALGSITDDEIEAIKQQIINEMTVKINAKTRNLKTWVAQCAQDELLGYESYQQRIHQIQAARPQQIREALKKFFVLYLDTKLAPEAKGEDTIPQIP